MGEARVTEPTDIGRTNLTTSSFCKRFGAKRSEIKNGRGPSRRTHRVKAENPTTSGMPKRFGAKRLLIQGEAGLRAEPAASRLTNPAIKKMH